MKMKWIYLTLLAVAIVLSGYAAIKSGLAAGDPTARPVESTAVLPTEGPAEPAPQMIHQAAVIETVNVRLEDGVQPLAALEISGWLPSACAQLDDIQIHLEGGRLPLVGAPQGLASPLAALGAQSSGRSRAGGGAPSPCHQRPVDRPPPGGPAAAAAWTPVRQDQARNAA